MLVDEILSKSDVPPIVILQADHGPASTFGSDGWARPTENMLRERTSIFNAYYLPQGGSDLLYNSITPVNTFRLIFNRYFKTNYDLLNDKIYFSDYEQPYKLIDVTDILTGGSVCPAGRAHGLCRANASDLAPDERPAGSQGPFLLQRTGDVQGVLCLGRLGLQFDPAGQDATTRSQRRPAPLAAPLARDGGGPDGPHLDDQGVIDYCCSS